jgi:hypothetical protein
MNRRLKRVLLFLVDPRSLVLAFSLFNFVHIWHLARNGGHGVVPPWYFPWRYFNEPTLLLAAAVFLRINRIWASCVSGVLSGYLVGYFVWLFAIYPQSIWVALHYEWLSLKQGPFMDSWDGQYLFAFIILCCSMFYLARATRRRSAQRRTTDNKALQLTAR